MALKPGTKEFEDWRKKNFNLGVKVPQSAIDKLMAGKTPSNNIKKYAGTNNAVMREAMNRFYGKGWEKKAPGFNGKSGGNSGNGGNGRNGGGSNGGGSTPVKPKYGTNTPSARAIEGSKGYTGPKKKPLTSYEKNYKKLAGVTPGQVKANSPITSVGGYLNGKWDGGKKVPLTAMSYSKLNAAQKDLVHQALLSMLPVGVGLRVGIKAIQAVKGAVTATKFAKAVQLEQAATKPLALGVGPQGKIIQMTRYTAAQEAKAAANATKAAVTAAEKKFTATIAKNTANFKKGLITRSEFVKLNDQARAAKLSRLMDGAKKTKGKK